MSPVMHRVPNKLHQLSVIYLIFFSYDLYYSNTPLTSFGEPVYMQFVARCDMKVSAQK